MHANSFIRNSRVHSILETAKCSPSIERNIFWLVYRKQESVRKWANFPPHKLTALATKRCKLCQQKIGRNDQVRITQYYNAIPSAEETSLRYSRLSNLGNSYTLITSVPNILHTEFKRTYIINLTFAVFNQARPIIRIVIHWSQLKKNIISNYHVNTELIQREIISPVANAAVIPTVNNVYYYSGHMPLPTPSPEPAELAVLQHASANTA